MPHSSLVDVKNIQDRKICALSFRSKQASGKALQLWAAGEYAEVALTENDVAIHIDGIWSRWHEILSNREAYSRLGQAPGTGRCDTLGTIQVQVSTQRRLPSNLRLCHRAQKTNSTNLAPSDPSASPPDSNVAGRQRGTGRSAVAKGSEGTKSELLSPTGYTEGSQNSEKVTSVIDLMASSRCMSHPPNAMTAAIDDLENQFAGVDLKESTPPEDAQQPPAYHTRSQAHNKAAPTLKTTAPQNDTTQPAKKSANAMQTLELPIVLVEYKTDGGEIEGQYIPPKGANQHRMYCTAATRFLEAVGITEYPVFSVICDGPLAMLTVAWADKEGIVHVAERHTEQFDISTPLGSWEYATVLCRLALWQSKALLKEFKLAEAKLVELLQLPVDQRDAKLKWTMKHQIDELIKAGIIEREEKESKDAKSEVKQTSK